MTLKEAKDKIAKKYGADSWWSLDFAALPQEALRDEAAELYARSKWDQACDEQKELCYANMGSVLSELTHVYRLKLKEPLVDTGSKETQEQLFDDMFRLYFDLRHELMLSGDESRNKIQELFTITRK